MSTCLDLPRPRSHKRYSAKQSISTALERKNENEDSPILSDNRRAFFCPPQTSRQFKISYSNWHQRNLADCGRRVCGDGNATTEAAMGRTSDTDGLLACSYHGRPGDKHGLYRESARQHHLGRRREKMRWEKRIEVHSDRYDQS